MSYLFDSGPQGLAGSYHFGGPGLGVLGSVIRATTGTGPHGPGYLFNEWDDASDDSKELQGLVTSWPSAGLMFPYEDGSFEFSGAPDGTYSFTYQVYSDGAALGSPQTDTITIGAGGVSGGSSTTLGAFTQTATGTVAVSGTSSVTLGPFTQTALGSVAISAISALTMGAFTQSAAGTVGQPPIIGSASTTMQAFTQAAAGTVTGSGSIVGGGSSTMGAFSQVATGTLTVRGISSVTLGAFTQVATATVAVQGTAALTMGAFTQSATGLVGQAPVLGSSSLVLGSFTQVATGTVSTTITVTTPPSRRLDIQPSRRALDIRKH